MKGQVEAPIELVVAIIVLVMSMALAFMVINQSETGRCLATLKTQTQQLQEAMLDVALGSTGSRKSTTFNMLRCGDKNVESLQFVQYTSPEYCRLCPGHYGGCWQIVPVARTRDGLVQVTESITCVELPVEGVSILKDEGPGCAPLSTTACASGQQGCSNEQFGITSSVQQNAKWHTLGGDSSKSFLVSFSKITLSSDVGTQGREKSGIRICAKPGFQRSTT